jgi:hypothetical protein
MAICWHSSSKPSQSQSMAALRRTAAPLTAPRGCGKVTRMDLRLDISSLSAPGRRSQPLEAAVVRPLRDADLAMLADNRGTTQPALKRISERHHALARNLAAGLSPGEAAAIVGLCSSRVSVLQGDPAFEELVRFYRGNKDAVYADMYEQLAGMGKDALLLLRERLEETPEDFTNGMLLDVVTKLADRSGHGPTSTQQNLNVNVNIASRLEEARKRARSAAQGQVIEGEVFRGDA